MAFEITDNTVGIWFISSIKNDRDVLLHLGKEHESFKIIGRIRYYDLSDPGNNPHSGKDTKKWFSASSQPSSNTQENIEAVRMLATDYKKEWGGGKITELLMDDKGMDDFKKRFFESDFVHVKVA